MKRLLAMLMLIATAWANAAYGQKNSKVDYMTSGEPVLAKMSSQLLQARLDVMRGGAPQEMLRRNMPGAMRDGKAQCMIGVTAVSDDVLSACKQAGLEVVKAYPDQMPPVIVVRCSDPRQFEPIARRPDVRLIISEPQATTNRPVRRDASLTAGKTLR